MYSSKEKISEVKRICENKVVVVVVVVTWIWWCQVNCNTLSCSAKPQADCQ